MQHVSSVLSKIPYGGFSPVRLQTEIFHRHLHRLRRLISGLKRRRPPDLADPRTESEARGGIASAFRSRGPWLCVGLFCPVASLLTMASSELLTPLRSAYGFRRPVFALTAAGQKVPDLSCESFCSCRLPYPGRPDGQRRFNVRP